ncbi:MAG: deoxyguanosinetriphosphate triphosphohydrolase [Lachnospiraceae bacterium]|jgi:dGTPase|nr:deoxyguanosinetriphosphate triphosphohydrolase [Lachnospiraceae bacterium]
MRIREEIEQWENRYLSPYASKSMNSMGRDIEEEECDIRPVYQRDRDRILHSNSFRRLKDKTQVFLAPEGDHYRTRLTHTLEVSQNARTIAKALRLNEDLTEAIALGHDIGHTPFGHAGERALARVCPEGFEHNVQSVRVVEVLEKRGAGLNLTREVRDGILNHKTKGMPSTLEGKIVRFSDKIAYIHHDMDDAIRGKILCEEDIPKELRNTLGDTTTKRFDCFTHDIIRNSEDKNDICMSDEIAEAMKELRQFMFDNVYTNPRVKSEETKAERLVEFLYDHYLHNQEKLPEEYRALMQKRGTSLERAVCDYVSSMSDRYAVAMFNELFLPSSWKEM